MNKPRSKVKTNTMYYQYRKSHYRNKMILCPGVYNGKWDQKVRAEETVEEIHVTFSHNVLSLWEGESTKYQK